MGGCLFPPGLDTGQGWGGRPQRSLRLPPSHLHLSPAHTPYFQATSVGWGVGDGGQRQVVCVPSQPGSPVYESRLNEEPAAVPPRPDSPVPQIPSCPHGRVKCLSYPGGGNPGCPHSPGEDVWRTGRVLGLALAMPDSAPRVCWLLQGRGWNSPTPRSFCPVVFPVLTCSIVSAPVWALRHR